MQDIDNVTSIEKKTDSELVVVKAITSPQNERSTIVGVFKKTDFVGLGKQNTGIVIGSGDKAIFFTLYTDLTIGGNVYPASDLEGVDITSPEYRELLDDVLDDLVTNIFASCCSTTIVVNGGNIQWVDYYSDLPDPGIPDTIYIVRDTGSQYEYLNGRYIVLVERNASITLYGYNNFI
jgi:hypothetical protein